MSLKLTLVASALAMLVSQTAMAADVAGSEAGVSITDADLTTMFRDAGYDISQVPEPQVENNLKNELARRVIVANAKKAGFDKSPEVAHAMEHAAEEELVHRFVLTQAQVPAGFPSDAEVQAAYNNNKSKMLVPRRVRVAEIYMVGVDDVTEKRAKALDTELKAHPDNFPDAAAKNGGDRATAANGGDWLAMKSLPPDIAKAIDAAPKGGVTSVVADKTGFHIIRVIDRAEETTPTLEQVKPNLIAAMREAKVRELGIAYYNQVVAQSPPVINQGVLAKLSAPGTVPPAPTPGAAPTSR